MAKENKFGNIVYSGKLDNGIGYEVTQSNNPFGEEYLVLSIGDEMVTGLIIDKKKTGTIEIRNKVSGTVRIAEDGSSQTEESEPTRDLE